MTDEEFDIHIESVKTKLAQKDLNLGEEFSRFHNEMLTSKLNWNR